VSEPANAGPVDHRSGVARPAGDGSPRLTVGSLVV
jgi:hypothetical protein